jgi:hypothetical protein
MTFKGGVLLFLAAAIGAGEAREMKTEKPLSMSPLDIRIAVPEKASKTERFAAEELARYIKAMTGATPEIATDSKTGPGGTILAVGKCAQNKKFEGIFAKAARGAEPDCFVIAAEGNTVALCGGGDRGTLYSVYEFLERQGCRWFYPGKLGEVIPARKDIILPSGIKKYEPDFAQREIDLGCPSGATVEEVIDWAAKNRLNRVFNLREARLVKLLPKDKQDAWEKRGGCQKWQWIAHNFEFMLPPDKYFKDHPEYYALYNGKRIPIGTPGRAGYGGGNICTTNPDVIKICADFAIDWFEKNPDGLVVPMWPSDGAVKWCECEACQKLGGANFMPGEKGSMSRRMAVFANAAAKITAEKFPDRYILCPAYANYIIPPDIPMEKNVLVQYCFHGDYAHAPDKSPKNKQEKDWLEGWARMNPGAMGVWEYFLIGDFSKDDESAAILPVARRAKDSIQFFKRAGLSWYFTQASARYWKHNILPFYVTARSIWDSGQDFDRLMDDYFSGMHGEAGDDVKNIYKLIEESAQKSDWYPVMYSDIAAPSAKVFTKDVLEKCGALLKEAESKKLEPVQKERLRLVKESLDFVKANAGSQDLLGLDPNSPWELERRDDHYLINAKGREISEKDMRLIIANALDSGTFTEDFERLLFRAQKRKAPLVSLETDAIKVSVIPEIGGRIIRLTDRKTGRNFLKETPSGEKLENIGAFYFGYGGYEEFAGKMFGSPGWEKKYKWTKTEDESKCSVTMETELNDLRLTRVISTDKNKPRELTVKSTLTNNGGAERKTCLRAHPAAALGKDSANCGVYIKMKDGSVKETSAGEAHDTVFPDTAGVWALVNEKENIGLAEIFNPEQASPYLCRGGADDHIYMELMGKERTLKPGESLALEHKYAVLSDAAAELPRYLPVRVTPEKGCSVSYKPGKVKEAAAFGDGEFLLYNLERCAKGRAGTVEMWVKPALPVKDTADAFLFSAGNNSPLWFFGSLGKGKVTFLYKNGRSPYRGEGEFYASMSADADWRADEWRHLAFVWADAGKGNAIMQIYIDGNIAAERYDLTLGDALNAKTIGVACGTASQTKNSFKGEIDELRFSNCPRSKSEILDSLRKGMSGAALSADANTLALFHFDKSPDGGSAANTALTEAELKEKTALLLKQTQRGN